MPNIDIRRAHTLDPAHARAAVEAFAQGLAQRHGLRHHWAGDVMHIERPGVSGAVHLEAESIRVQLRLGLFAAALKPLIEQEIERRLDAWLA